MENKKRENKNKRRECSYLGLKFLHWNRVSEMNRFYHLPEEVVEGIVLRLSPKSLISCKRVCKSWHSLINGKSFVSKLLRFHIESTRYASSVSLFLKWKRQELTLDEIFTSFYSSGNRKQVMTLVTISGDRLPCVVEEISLPPAPKSEEKHFPKSIVSIHCNGIIWLFEAFNNPSDAIVLFNASISEFKFLHTPELLPKFLSSGSGFWYDSKTNDHKYVKLFCSSFSLREESKLLCTRWEMILGGRLKLI